jgi:hypothetical protein
LNCSVADRVSLSESGASLSPGSIGQSMMRTAKLRSVCAISFELSAGTWRLRPASKDTDPVAWAATGFWCSGTCQTSPALGLGICCPCGTHLLVRFFSLADRGSPSEYIHRLCCSRSGARSPEPHLPLIVLMPARDTHSTIP